MKNDKPIICLMGPTASGKTKLALELCEKLPCEIISVDSALVYHGMNIGTAKPDDETLKKYPHRLISFRDPSEAYSAADFCNDAQKEIKNILAQNKIPLLVGGTMLYFKVLQQGLSSLPSADQTVRQKILREAEKNGWPSLHKKLKAIDPESAKRIHPNDAQRLQRALEIIELSGKTPSEFYQQQEKSKLPYHFINIALTPSDRKILHQRIEERFLLMLDSGFVDEVKKLYERGDLNKNLPSIRAVGYSQVWDYLDGKLSYSDMVEKGIATTRQFAKRQLTWLRSWHDLHWFESDNKDLVNQVLNYLELQL